MEQDIDTYEYELIDIEISNGYDYSDEQSGIAREEEPSDEQENGEGDVIEYDADGIPMGRTRNEIKVREKIIKDFYAHWIAEHPTKAIFNRNLNKPILVKYQSINETYNKAARSYASTLAVMKLTEILENAEAVDEVIPKSNRNQKQYEKMIVMRYGNVKLIVGLQKSTQEHVQYSITVPQQ